MPAGFTPDLSYGPIELDRGNEVAVAGTMAGKSTLIGFGGAGMTTPQIIAQDYGLGAPHGRLIGVAARPDAAELAIAIAEPEQSQVEVVVRDGSAQGEGKSVAKIAGVFDRAQLRWLDATTIVVALKSDRPDAKPSSTTGDAGIQLIHLADTPTTRALTKIRCELSALSFSPDAKWVVAQGDQKAPPVLIDLPNEACTPLARREPIRVIAWAPDSSAFLYVASGPERVPGIFRYNRASGNSTVITIASGAAAYASDGTLIAVGNDRLTWRAAASAPQKPIGAQIALWPIGQQELTLNSLGFETTPELLARASMGFSPASDNGVIDIVAVWAQQPVRELIEYSLSARAAFVLAATPVDAAIVTSWSPDGKVIAVIDGSAEPNMLTVIATPR